MLAAGELVWVDFDPAFGHEQAGRRPALIISDGKYNEESSFILVCPITRNARHWPFKIVLSDKLPVGGQILVDQIKSIDKRRVVSPAIGTIEESGLAEVRGLLAVLLGFSDAKR
ncbi:MAG: type II toxin-antitoxin system PemK/MazF family toxin [Beijerinckiaceae bacterium]